MKVTTERNGNALIVRLDGELDLQTAPAFRDAVEGELANSARLKHLVLVLADVPFVDSSGLGAILGRYKSVRQRGGRIVVVAPQPPVQKAFQVAGLLKLIELSDSEKRALDHVRAG